MKTRSTLGQAPLAGHRQLFKLTEAKAGRERVLVQYGDYGNQLKASRKTRPTLEAGLYKITESMEGIFYEKIELNSDEIIKFEDHRLDEVEAEIDGFWGLAESFSDMGITHKRGVLLFGAPGMGKTCLLKRVSESAIEKDIVVFVGSRNMGATVQGLREFKEVEPTRRTLVMMEDMDEICAYNEHAVLELMDGGDQMNGVLILGTTNYPERLPPRVMRAGRFDTKLEVKALPIEGRIAYFQHKLSKVESAERIQKIAEMTDGFSFAQMRELIASAYCYKRPLEASIDRIRRNFNESGVQYSTDRRLNRLMESKGLDAPHSSAAWKQQVRESGSQHITRSRINPHVIVAYDGNGQLLGRFNERSGVEQFSLIV